MEAMACGVPTFGTDAGGVSELIDDGKNGILVPPKNPSVLARVLRDFAGNPELAMRLSTAGRAHVVENFSSELGAQTIVRMIDPDGVLDTSTEEETTPVTAEA
jgi:glycosyltransferase involved in cell wall biosynthesis